MNTILVKTPSVIGTILNGGLGNRLFQCASGYGLAKTHNKPLYIARFEHNEYSQNIFEPFTNIPHHKINNCETIHIEKIKDQYAHVNVVRRKNTLILVGFFQSEKYFSKYREDIINMFGAPDIVKHQILAEIILIIHYTELIWSITTTLLLKQLLDLIKQRIFLYLVMIFRGASTGVHYYTFQQHLLKTRMTSLIYI
jgi:hypothetical protein